MASSSPRPSSAPSVIALYGPTASGKTAVAAALLARLDAEVVTAD
jgi:tRNA A37 N6-isopentenylltransferase MiaA